MIPRGMTTWITACLWIIYAGDVLGQFDANFTLQNVWGRLQPDMRSLIQCLSEESHKKIKFTRMMDTGQGPKLPKSTQQFSQGKPVFARILHMPGEDKLSRFGVYQCKIIKNNIGTRIVALKLPPDNLVELDALTPYLSASVGDRIELVVNATQSLGLAVRWLHDGKPVPDWAGRLAVTISDATVKDAGVYECFYEGRRNESVHALMRVLVRSCPQDLYGDTCDQECPPCYNGGVCHDKWGVCVCPAGFTGPNCEIACGGNHFGADCNKFCSPPQNNSNTDELCALHLFCKPDPYGCSCAPGFKGSNCMEHCEPGWYGADCKQPCHCAHGVSSCNRITGACDGGCARGWRGQSCQIEDPNPNSSYVETTTLVYCSPGTYGPSCEKRCHCAGNELCHIITGHCPSGCEDGFERPTCGTCRSGRYGDNCQSTCHCEGGHNNCDKDGFCYLGCQAGWAGFTCQAECTPGRFGPNCAMTCHCHENSTSPCDRFSGECEGDCEPGFMGKDCQTMCPASTYGINCVHVCECSNGAPCNRVDGSCACDGRWRGKTCNESEPQIVASSDEEVNSGQPVYVSCTADAVPEPQLNISCNDFPGLKVSLRHLDKNQYQAVVKLRPETSGKFHFLCTAKNDHGFDMKKIVLTVLDPPVLVYSPFLVGQTNHSLSIKWSTWNHGDDIGGAAGDKVEYLVVYRELGAQEWVKSSSWIGPLSPGSSYDVTGLSPNTQYEVAVKCKRHKEGGIGEPSPVLLAKTECGACLPEGIPQGFLPDKISPNSVSFSWKNPQESFLHCRLSSYHLTFHPEAEESILVVMDTDDVATSVLLEDLTPNTNYVVRLHPVTDYGTCHYFAEIIIRTAETVPPPVLDLECQAPEDKPDLLVVSWEAPSDRNGAIKGYLVTYALLDRGQCGAPSETDDLRYRQLLSDDTEMTLQNLHPYSTYNVSVQARTSAGEGELVWKLATTAESVPSEAPPNVRVTASSNQSLTFEWEAVPCEEANGDVIRYQYNFMRFGEEGLHLAPPTRPRRSLENISHIFESVQDREVSMQNLEPFTTYGFMVAAVTAVGEGVLSDLITHRTEEGVPDAPRNPDAFLVTDESIGVAWEGPERPNGIVTAYRVRAWDPSTIPPSAAIEVTREAAAGDGRLSAVVTGLRPAVDYQISIEATTSVGWGKQTIISERTLDGAPGEPEEILVLENQLESIHVAWKEPVEKNGVITGYKIKYRPILTLDPVFNSTPMEGKETGAEANATDVILEDLHPSTQYRVRVSAETSAGHGPEASIDCWTTILGDHVTPSLKMLEVEATNDSIPIVFSTTGSSSVYKYQVVVEDASNRWPIDESLLSDFETGVERGHLPYYIAAELDARNVSASGAGEHAFLVGDRGSWGGYHNVHLNPGHRYRIRIRTLVLKDKEVKSVLSPPQNETAGTAVVQFRRTRRTIFGINVILFILLVVGAFIVLASTVFCIAATVCFRRARKKSTTSFSTRDSGLSGSMTWSVMYKVPENEREDMALINEGFRTLPHSLHDKNPSLKRSRSEGKIAHGLRIETLEEYLINAKSSNTLTEEFDRLVEGQITSWTVARKSVNAKKNRYGNILPYDRYRVVLKTNSKDETDYINASYVDGFRRPREYIVTQGPLENTVNDFWRMIWQEHSPVVVMVTGMVENGRKKCAQYWPDDSMDIGDLHILLIHLEKCKDYIVRTILIRKIDEIGTHRVVQYEFSAWPDRTVPTSTNSLIKFMRRVREDHPVLSGPMVVHCSAGAGRSGAYVAIDALCQQAEEDKRVDVFRYVNNARHQRVHLVQTKEQYAFIYEALVEAIHFEDTSLRLDKIGMYLKELDHMSTIDRRSLILRQYNKLNRIQKKMEVNRCSVALSEVNISKNRDPLTVPGNFSRIRLDVVNPDEDNNDYINAIYVDGYSKPSAFILTQMPLSHTVLDFWRLIYQQKSPLIIMLNGCDEYEDLNVGIYWPEDGDFCSFGYFDIQLIAKEEQRDFVIRVMRVIDTQKPDDDPLKVTQLQYRGWSSEMKPSSMLALIEKLEMWYEKSASGGPITVHCRDGATRSGLLVASKQVCDQVESEGVLDAYQIVKSVRANRPECIPNSDQYRLLFEVALEVAEPYLIQMEEQKRSSKKLSFKI